MNFDKPTEERILKVLDRSRSDVFVFYRSTSGDWRWSRRSQNAETVGASTESYRNQKDCIDNAIRNGFNPAVHAVEVL